MSFNFQGSRSGNEKLVSYAGIVTDDSFSHSAIYTLDQVHNSDLKGDVGNAV